MGSYTGVAPNMQVPVYSKAFTSAEQTITTAGLLTLAHGLGVTPTEFSASIVCKVAEAEWLVGDELPVAITQESSSAADSYGIAVYADSTNIYVRYGAGSPAMAILKKVAGTGFNATNANWKLIVRAVA